MPKILVIDDEISILELVSDILRNAHYDVIGASTGEAGLKLAIAEQPDLVLCDIDLGGMNGYTVLRKLREEAGNLEVPVIFISGQASPKHNEAGMVWEANDYLCKPATRPEILSAIHRQLGKDSASK